MLDLGKAVFGKWKREVDEHSCYNAALFGNGLWEGGDSLGDSNKGTAVAAALPLPLGSGSRGLGVLKEHEAWEGAGGWRGGGR